MRATAALLALTAGLHAASIRGVVLESQTGHPLVRASVVIEPLSGTRGNARGARTGLNGEFAIDGLYGGSYLITAARRGFAPVQYGQKRWGAAGLPVHIDEKEEATLEIRMSRYGAVAGAVVDENNVGLPGHPVAAYRDVRPLLPAAQGITNDRGEFRLFGLEPGAYLVRSLTRIYEDTSYVPTFFKDAQAAAQANAVEVELGEDTRAVDIHAAPGVLFKLDGVVAANAAGGVANAQVTLTSDTASVTVTTDDHGLFQFAQLPPTRYELSASGRSPRDPSIPLAAFRQFQLDRDMTDQRLTLEPLPQVTASLLPFDSAPGDVSKAQVLIRHSGVAGPGKVDPFKVTDDGAAVAPGYWEFALAPSAAVYCATFTAPDGERTALHADGWNRVLIPPASNPVVKFAVAGNPSSIQGTVKGATGNGVPDVPVFLEPTDLDPTRRLTDFRWVRADAQGRFSFAGLAPGAYRVMGTFEFLNPRAIDFDHAQAVPVTLAAGQNAAQDVELFVMRTAGQF